MPGIESGRENAINQRRASIWSDPAPTPSDLVDMVEGATINGCLAALLAIACEKAVMYFPATYADPGQTPHEGVRAAIRAYSAWKNAQEGPMDMDVQHLIDTTGAAVEEPEVLPLSLAGLWVAWSSDGLRIVASATTIEEAERLAAIAGEPEPILDRHPGRHRL